MTVLTTTLFSNRIYKKDLSAETNSALCDLMKEYGHLLFGMTKELSERYKHGYKLSFTDTGRDNLSLYQWTKDEFPTIPTYVRNTAYREAKGLIDAVVANRNNRLSETKEKLSHIETKINRTSDSLQTFDKYKRNLVLYSRGELSDIKGLIKGSRSFKIVDGKIVRYSQKGKKKQKRITDVFDNVYDFELYIDKQTKILKARKGLLIYKKNKLTDKLDKLEREHYLPGIQFGGKKLCKQSKTDKWKKKEFLSKRYNRFACGGRNDSKYGNYIFEYDPANNILRLNHLNASDKDKAPSIEIPSVFFPYGQDTVNKYYSIQMKDGIYNKKNSGRKPITYSIEDKGKYYIIKCMVEEEKPPDRVTGFANGAIGIDINCGFISVCETDKDGNLVRAFDIPYEYRRRNSNQISNNIYNAVKQITAFALMKQKSVVIENLKIPTSDKIKRYNSNKKKNFKISVFAYSKIKEAIRSSASKNGIAVSEVSPAYTSLIASVKYKNYYKRSIHQTAALVIGRRGIGYRETIPTVWKEKLQQSGKQINWKNVYQLYKK